jgi:hypothetical protein
MFTVIRALRRRSSKTNVPYKAKDMLARLDEVKIEYVPKEESPLNVPQLRPIKNF